MLIFVHIPKTAGTSFKNLLNKVYSSTESIIIDSSEWYRDANFTNLSNRTCLPGAQQIRPPVHIKYIVGHFNADRFINLYPAATYITWVRDPIQRLISNYNYYLRGGTYYGQMSDQKRNYDLISLETYCTHKLNINAMSQQINMPLSNFKFIGIVEKYEEELARFKKITGIDIVNDSNYSNINPDKKHVKENYILDEELKEKLINLHDQDYKLYKNCLNLAGY